MHNALTKEQYRTRRRGAVAVAILTLSAAAYAAPALAQERIDLAVDASKSGAKIDRNIFGQFAEHLGSGVYGGIWVGRGSSIPNTRGIRNDVVAALRALKERTPFSERLALRSMRIGM